MATVAKQYTFTSGTKILSAQVNANFDDLYNDYNGNITNANLAPNAAIADTKLAQITTGSKVALSALPVSGTAGQTVVTGTGTGAEWAGMTTAGDIDIRGATNRVRLAVGGTAGKTLITGTGGYPEWGGMAITGDIEYCNGTTRGVLGTNGAAWSNALTLGSSGIPIWSGMKAAGDIEYSNGTTRTALTAGAWGEILMSLGTNGLDWVSQAPFAMGTTSLDSAVTGTAARISGTTGVGFKPRWVIFLTSDDTGKQGSSIGFASGAVSGSNMAWYNNATGTAGLTAISATKSINVVQGSATAYLGAVTAFTTGGWNWTFSAGTNACTGNVSVSYMAFGAMGTQ